MVHDKSWFMFNNADESREVMGEYIRRRFANVIGDDIVLLDQPGGLDELQKKINERLSVLQKAA